MTVVLDSSALLAYLFDETGTDRVAPLLEGALISAVNLTEVVTKTIDAGDDPDLTLADLAELTLVVVPFDRAQAATAARLRTTTRRAGLSLGDRACLALAHSRGLPAITGDRAWAAIAEDVGVAIELIR